MPEKEYRFVPHVSVAIVTSDLNIRKGAPASSSKVIKEATPGMPLRYIGYIVDGESVAGIAKWFLTPEGDFFWSGNVKAEGVDTAQVFNKRVLVKPLDSLVCTQRFGERPAFYSSLGSPRGHSGMDFRTKQADGTWTTPVYAAMKGTVAEVDENMWNGKFIRIDHPNGFQSIYLHLSETSVETGQEVTSGQKIGLSGNTGGASEAPHLHFGYRPIKFDKDNGTMGYIDPAPYFIDEIKYLT
ncbi:MAG TPA: M23 family metallopeptidase [Candidatus Paceibacterota bacterium]